ncbi:MAG: tetratricopeptide repeat protein [Proteobacteria bacterium]|nr:tetratricopeptide repeat protein [Pseudomonadota bacterium]
MLEFGKAAPAAPAADLVIDGSEATFMDDVIEASKEVPVIVDFWAPWCGPCKTLGPALEAAVTKAGGKVRMVKINVDENQQISAQMRIQSIPAVYAFFDGKPVDGFTGNQTPAKITEFVGKLAALAGDGGLSESLEIAEQMLTDGEATDAAQTFAAILDEDPSIAAAYGGLVRAHLALGETAQASELLTAAPAAMANSVEIAAAKAQLELALATADAGPVAELQQAVEADPANFQARFDLAVALLAADDAEGAVAQLLELFRRDREWNDGAAKAQLFTIFNALKPQDPIVLNGRRKLSSMIFA